MELDLGFGDIKLHVDYASMFWRSRVIYSKGKYNQVFDYVFVYVVLL